MIHKSISTSKQVNGMSDFAELLFTWAIAHADDFGCLDGDPEVVMATIIPMKRSRTVDEVQLAVSEWVDAGLVWWFELNEQKVIQLIKWDKHQTGLHKRTKSKYPLHDEAMVSEKFRELPRIPSLTELNRTELNRTELNDESLVLTAYKEQAATSEDSKDSSSSDSHFGELATIFQAEGFGQGTPLVYEQLKDIYATYGYESVKDAFRESVRQNVRRLSYVERILRNWKVEGKSSGGEINVKYSSQSRASPSASGEEDDYIRNLVERE